MIIDIALLLLLLTAGISTIRLFRGPSIADRIIALDVVLVTLMGGIAIQAAEDGATLPLPTLVAIAVVAFTATVALTRYIERSDPG